MNTQHIMSPSKLPQLVSELNKEVIRLRDSSRVNSVCLGEVDRVRCELLESQNTNKQLKEENTKLSENCGKLYREIDDLKKQLEELHVLYDECLEASFMQHMELEDLKEKSGKFIKNQTKDHSKDYAMSCLVANGYSIRMIAKLLNISPTTVKSRLDDLGVVSVKPMSKSHALKQLRTDENKLFSLGITIQDIERARG